MSSSILSNGQENHLSNGPDSLDFKFQEENSKEDEESCIDLTDQAEQQASINYDEWKKQVSPTKESSMIPNISYPSSVGTRPRGRPRKNPKNEEDSNPPAKRARLDTTSHEKRNKEKHSDTHKSKKDRDRPKRFHKSAGTDHHRSKSREHERDRERKRKKHRSRSHSKDDSGSKYKDRDRKHKKHTKSTKSQLSQPHPADEDLAHMNAELSGMNVINLAGSSSEDDEPLQSQMPFKHKSRRHKKSHKHSKKHHREPEESEGEAQEEVGRSDSGSGESEEEAAQKSGSSDCEPLASRVHFSSESDTEGVSEHWQITQIPAFKGKRGAGAGVPGDDEDDDDVPFVDDSGDEDYVAGAHKKYKHASAKLLAAKFDEWRCSVCERPATDIVGRKAHSGAISPDRYRGYYYGVPACKGCQVFYRRMLLELKDYKPMPCPKGGTCGVLANVGYCIPCRFNKCLEVFPPPESLKKVLKSGSGDLSGLWSSEAAKRIGSKYKRAQQAKQRQSSVSSASSESAGSPKKGHKKQREGKKGQNKEKAKEKKGKSKRSRGELEPLISLADRGNLNRLSSRVTKWPPIVPIDESKVPVYREVLPHFLTLAEQAVQVLGHKLAFSYGVGLALASSSWEQEREQSALSPNYPLFPLPSSSSQGAGLGQFPIPSTLTPAARIPKPEGPSLQEIAARIAFSHFHSPLQSDFQSQLEMVQTLIIESDCSSEEEEEAEFEKQEEERREKAANRSAKGANAAAAIENLKEEDTEDEKKDMEAWLEAGAPFHALPEKYRVAPVEDAGIEEPAALILQRSVGHLISLTSFALRMPPSGRSNRLYSMVQLALHRKRLLRHFEKSLLPHQIIEILQTLAFRSTRTPSHPPELAALTAGVPILEGETQDDEKAGNEIHIIPQLNPWEQQRVLRIVRTEPPLRNLEMDYSTPPPPPPLSLPPPPPPSRPTRGRRGRKSAAVLAAEAAAAATVLDSSLAHTSAPGDTSSAVTNENSKPPHQCRRIRRCKQCIGCKTSDCGRCLACLDMKKFGGQGILRLSCFMRICRKPFLPYTLADAAPSATQSRNIPSSRQLVVAQLQLRRAAENEILSRFTALQTPILQSNLFEEQDSGKREGKPVTDNASGSSTTSKGGVDSLVPSGAAAGLDLEDEDEALSVPTLNPEIFEIYDAKTDAASGVAAITTSGTFLNKSLCFLCASAGNHKFLYCNACCEPYHWFCVPETQRPTRADHISNWFCPRCLRCDRCRGKRYLNCCNKCSVVLHASCIHKAYPSTSKFGQWLCEKCAICKGCGARADAQPESWSEDFEHCRKCSALVQKGNQCKLCCKTYTEQEIKDSRLHTRTLIQCSVCRSWVHSACESISSFQHAIIGNLGSEQFTFICRLCLERNANLELAEEEKAIASRLEAAAISGEQLPPEYLRGPLSEEEKFERISISVQTGLERRRKEIEREMLLGLHRVLDALTSESTNDYKLRPRNEPSSSPRHSISEHPPSQQSMLDVLGSHERRQNQRRPRNPLGIDIEAAAPGPSYSGRRPRPRRPSEASIGSQGSDFLYEEDLQADDDDEDYDPNMDDSDDEWSKDPKKKLPKRFFGFGAGGFKGLGRRGGRGRSAYFQQLMPGMALGMPNPYMAPASAGYYPPVPGITAVPGIPGYPPMPGAPYGAAAGPQSHITQFSQYSIATPGIATPEGAQLYANQQMVAAYSQDPSVFDYGAPSYQDPNAQQAYATQAPSMNSIEWDAFLQQPNQSASAAGAAMNVFYTGPIDYGGSVLYGPPGSHHSQSAHTHHAYPAANQQHPSFPSLAQLDGTDDPNPTAAQGATPRGSSASRVQQEASGSALNVNTSQDDYRAILNGLGLEDVSSTSSAPIAYGAVRAHGRPLPALSSAQAGGSIRIGAPQPAPQYQVGGALRPIRPPIAQYGLAPTVSTPSAQPLATIRTPVRPVISQVPQPQARLLPPTYPDQGIQSDEATNPGGEFNEMALPVGGISSPAGTHGRFSSGIPAFGQRSSYAYGQQTPSQMSHSSYPPLPTPLSTAFPPTHATHRIMTEDAYFGRNPRGLHQIRQKLEDGTYTSADLNSTNADSNPIAQFADDVIRIIVHKLAVSASSIADIQQSQYSQWLKLTFQQKMKSTFGWLDLEHRPVWHANVRLPLDLLDQATLPPGPDHEYHQFRQVHLENAKRSEREAANEAAKRAARPGKRAEIQGEQQMAAIIRTVAVEKGVLLEDSQSATDLKSVVPTSDALPKEAGQLSEPGSVAGPELMGKRSSDQSRPEDKSAQGALLDWEQIKQDEAVASLMDAPDKEDPRTCLLCGREGDEKPQLGGRLLYFFPDRWIHVNCALWTPEVYEDSHGMLQNIFQAILRSQHSKCDACGNLGATITCCAQGCSRNYHLPCAHSAGVRFRVDVRAYCAQHVNPFCHEEQACTPQQFAVVRHIAIDPNNNYQSKANRLAAYALRSASGAGKGRPSQSPPSQDQSQTRVLFNEYSSGEMRLTVGSLFVDNLGELVAASDQPDYLRPLGFQSRRIFWSTKDPTRMATYQCRVITPKMLSDSLLAKFSSDPTLLAGLEGAQAADPVASTKSKIKTLLSTCREGLAKHGCFELLSEPTDVQPPQTPGQTTGRAPVSPFTSSITRFSGQDRERDLDLDLDSETLGSPLSSPVPKRSALRSARSNRTLQPQPEQDGELEPVEARFSLEDFSPQPQLNESNDSQDDSPPLFPSAMNSGGQGQSRASRAHPSASERSPSGNVSATQHATQSSAYILACPLCSRVFPDDSHFNEHFPVCPVLLGGSPPAAQTDAPSSTEVSQLDGTTDESISAGNANSAADVKPTVSLTSKGAPCRWSDPQAQELLYELVTDDGYHVLALDPLLAWRAVLSRVNRARVAQRLPPLYYSVQSSSRSVASSLGYTDEGEGVLNGMALFGLSHRYLVNLIEQLPRASLCTRYLFRHQFSSEHLSLAVSDTAVKGGSARTRVFDWPTQAKGRTARVAARSATSSARASRRTLALLARARARGPFISSSQSATVATDLPS